MQAVGPTPCPGPTNPFRVFRPEEVEQSIPARFAQQVAGDPGKVAVEAAGQRLTYEELNQAANRLAHALLAQRGDVAEPVAFLLGHGCPQLVAILGILQAGKIYVPLDDTYPLARITAVLQDARPALIVTDNVHRDWAQRLAGADSRVLNLDDLGTAGNDGDPDLALAPDRPANIIYTSGSTGKPAGLVHSHRNILHATLKYTNHFHIDRADRMALLYSCAFAGSVADIFSSLLNGATLLPFDVKKQGVTQLGPWLAGQEITLYQSVPTVFRQFVATLDGSERFPRLRLIRLGGETVTPHDVLLHRRHFSPGCLLAVSLAATEILGIRFHVLDHETPLSWPRVPVGYALPDTEVLILGDNGEPVPPGCVGTIAVRSPYLALGYWGDPERTQAAFRADPERPGVRMYRFGDRGLLLPDGCLEYLGRADAQVKVRGHRVEVAEIESALLAIPEVREAVVVGRETATGGQRLVAYVVPAARKPEKRQQQSSYRQRLVPYAEPALGWSNSRLRARLLETLPDYMIPSAFVVLDALPTTPTGKVDRQALPEPTRGRPALDNPYVPPGDPMQLLLAEAWEECLNVRPVGVRDNFFDLGGDSLLAVDLALRIEELCGRRLPEGALLSAPTVEQSARLLIQNETSPACPPLVEVQGGTERRLFFLHGDFNGGGLYSVPLARRIGKEQPFCAVHPHGLSSPLVPATIEEMAADRLRVLRAFQPEGPYLLAGHCAGGLVAVEMARQLVRLGQRVDFLAAVAPPPVQVGSALPNEVPSPAPVDLTGCPEPERRARLLRAYHDACARYVMRPFPGELVVVLPQADLAWCGGPERWRGAAERVYAAVIPGGHLTVLASRYMAGLAELLRGRLAAARAPR